MTQRTENEPEVVKHEIIGALKLREAITLAGQEPPDIIIATDDEFASLSYDGTYWVISDQLGVTDLICQGAEPESYGAIAGTLVVMGYELSDGVQLPQGAREVVA